MLKRIKAKLCFASTNKTIEFDHNLESGMTSISGPNESGKSLRLELIRYMLFGSKALRLPLKEYTTISGELEFSIGEANYRVVRNKPEAMLYKDNNPIAVGTTAVNNAIYKNLGYDLEVFDVANACLQDDITAMSKKTPSERKQMIDQTLGLDAIDILLKNINLKISHNKGSQSAIELGLKQYGDLIEPTRPDDYIENSNIKERIADCINQKTHYDQMCATLNNAECPRPITPDYPVDPEPVETLEELRAQQLNQSGLQTKISKINNELATLKYEINKYIPLKPETIRMYTTYVNHGYELKWANYNAYSLLFKKAELYPEITTRDMYNQIYNGAISAPILESINRLIEESTVVCPSCEYGFPIQLSEITVLEQSLPTGSKLQAQLDVKAWECYGSLSKSQMIELDETLNAREKLVSLGWDETPPREPDLPEGVAISAPALELILTKEQLYKDRCEKVTVLEAELAQLVKDVDNDIQSKLDLKQQYLFLKNNYDKQVEKYEAYCTLKDDLVPKIHELRYVLADLNKLLVIQESSADYEAKLESYKYTQHITEQMKSDLDKLIVEYDKLLAIKNGLTSIKPLVKSYLVPSLSSVASTFISKMTNNSRSAIVISNDFDITVDGEPVNALSGSGKAVANLAIRLALGTVLTNKVFSVFLADEVDSAMDSERAEHTSECLRNLTNVFKQVIIISHKKPDADHYIEL